MSSFIHRVSGIQMVAALALLAPAGFAAPENSPDPKDNPAQRAAPDAAARLPVPGTQPDLTGVVNSAVKKLADATGYTWKVTSDPRGVFMTGKTARGGYTLIESPWCTVVMKGDQAAICARQHEPAARWRTMAEAGRESSPNLSDLGKAARFVHNFRFPADRAEELADLAKGILKADTNPPVRRAAATQPASRTLERGPATIPASGFQNVQVKPSEPISAPATQPSVSLKAYSAELTEAGAMALLLRASGGSASDTELFNPSASVNFWVADGVLSKFSYHLQGVVIGKGKHGECNQTITIEITDVGTTKFDVPAEATAKLSPIN